MTSQPAVADAILPIDDLRTHAEAVGQVPTFSGNHLLALPFEVPLTYELADKTSHKVALTFRQGASPEWQKAACLAKYPDANPSAL